MGQVSIYETSLIHEEWSPDECDDDETRVGWHEDCERRCYATASSFPLESSERVTGTPDLQVTRA